MTTVWRGTLAVARSDRQLALHFHRLCASLILQPKRENMGKGHGACTSRNTPPTSTHRGQLLAEQQPSLKTTENVRLNHLLTIVRRLIPRLDISDRHCPLSGRLREPCCRPSGMCLALPTMVNREPPSDHKPATACMRHAPCSRVQPQPASPPHSPPSPAGPNRSDGRKQKGAAAWVV